MTRRVEIVDYRLEWPQEFAQIAAQLRKIFGPKALRINHIGSTSVPGLAAKDIIDIQVSVAELEGIDALVPALQELGIEYAPEISDDSIPRGLAQDDPLNNQSEWTKAYFRRRGTQQNINMHVRVLGRANQRMALLFRDYMRNNARAAAAYEQLKRTIAQFHPDSMEEYVDIKDPSIAIIFIAAEMWAEQTSWQLPESDA